MYKAKNILIALIFVLIIGSLSLMHLFLPDKELSLWERRRLQQLPEFTVTGILKGSYTSDFEAYLTDQFPLRDKLRSLKAQFHFNLLRQKDNNDICVVNGSASKLERKLSETSVKLFASKLTYLWDTYLKGTDCKSCFILVPDKNEFLLKGSLYPHFSFEEIYEKTLSGLPEELETIEISDLLSADSYYKTDSHWRQESLVPVANKIRGYLGVDILPKLQQRDVGEFYGVYYGQSALDLEADRLIYLTNEELEGATVRSIEKEGKSKVYDLSKLDALDRYDIFLSGAVSILEVSNPEGKEGKELIIFRDSFSSSLAPLLIPGYSKVTLIDTRYVSSKALCDYVDFESQDVLFVYGTGIVNNSSSLK